MAAPTTNAISVALADTLRGAPLVVDLPVLPAISRTLGQSGAAKTWP